MVMNSVCEGAWHFKGKRRQNFTGADVRNGMTAVIVAVKHPAPRFEGQTKTKLDNPDAGTRSTVPMTNDEIQLYFDKHLDDVEGCALPAQKRSAKIRTCGRKGKDQSFDSKPKFSIDSNGKLANCESPVDAAGM
ncbi:MAG: hypothetical protein ACLR6H_05280 [Roseburia sp.]